MKAFRRNFIFYCFLIICVFSFSTQSAKADITDATKELFNQNVNNIKGSIQELKNDLAGLKKDLTNADSQVKEILKKYENLVGGFNVENLKNTDTDNLQDRIDKIKTELKNGDILKSVGNEYKAKFEKFQKDVEEAIYSVKSIISINYTTPVGMRGGYGQTGLEITIDTLKYTRTDDQNGAVQMDVRADFQLPFSIAEGETNTKIGFVGEDVPLKGDEPARIKLDTKNTTGNFAGTQDIVYFPILNGKARIGVHKDSYVEFDCNGFRGLKLKGEFVFNSDIIYPAEKPAEKTDDEAETKPEANAESDSEAKTETKSTGDTVMTAQFDIYISDLEDIIIETGFKTPFKVKCTGDIVYEVHGLVADFSTLKNASDFQFPKGYKSPFKGSDDEYWTGFALKMLKVSVGDEIPFIDTLSAYNMLIDETGVSGWFGATFGDDKGKLETGVIDAKINKIEVAIANGKVIGGGLDGILDVVALKDKEKQTLKLNINGSVYSDPKNNFCYSIAVKNELDHTYELPLLQKSEVTLGAGTSISYEKQMDIKSNGTTKDTTYRRGFFFNLNGSISLEASFVKVDGLSFQDLQLSSCAPYFGGGKFALNSAKSLNLGALDIELLNVYAGFYNPDKDKEENKDAHRTASLGAEVNVKLIGDGKGVSCGGKFTCTTDVDDKWKPKELQVEKISVEADFSAFYLKGAIEKFDEEITPKNKFGRGFKGELEIRMDALNIDVQADAQFGKSKYKLSDNDKPFRYWYVYANVGLPPGTIIFPPAVMLNSVSLALYSRMNYTVNQTTKEITRDYFPDPSRSFGFQGGLKVCVAQEGLVGAEMKLGMDFGSEGGVKNINLEGGIYMLAESQDKSIINGTVRCFYDFEEEIFKFNAKVAAKLACIKGGADIEMYSDPKKWYFNLGTIYKAEENLNFAGIAKAKAYFMLGHGIPASLPPLDSRITQLFDVTQSTASGHQEECETGNGFAFGAAVSVGCGFNKFIYAGVSLLGGIDVLIVRRPGYNCENSPYRGYGRAYVWLDLGAGVKPRKKKFEFLEISAAAEVDAEFPKPLYLHGKIAFRYSVLGGLFSGHANTKFEAGNSCQWGPNGQRTTSDGEFDFSIYREPSLDMDIKDGENFEKLMEEHGIDDDHPEGNESNSEGN
ncbi:MAG: hypothetical protein U0K66_08860 [Paludibacteraceae bacterium]|nr:hypothetical protein [Paludibacteraceae bacterium]